MRPYVISKVKELISESKLVHAKQLLLADMWNHVNDMMNIQHSAASFSRNPMTQRVVPEVDDIPTHVKLPVLQFKNPKIFARNGEYFNCIGISRTTASFIVMMPLCAKKKFLFFKEPPKFEIGERHLRVKPNWLIDIIPHGAAHVTTLPPMSGIVLSKEQTNTFSVYSLGKIPIKLVNYTFVTELREIPLMSLLAIYQLTECASYIADL